MPQVGLGVFRATPEDTYDAVRYALQAGYRHIDTAQAYRNEAAVGAAVRDSGLARDDIFVTTKLWNDNQKEGQVERAFEQSVRQLDIATPDLFLLQWPVPKLRLTSWKVLERLYRDKRVRAIGVSNFMPAHLQELLDVADIVPAVNQIELSPFVQQRDVRAICKQQNIVVEAYSPLTKGQRLQYPVITPYRADSRKIQRASFAALGHKKRHSRAAQNGNRHNVLQKNLDLFLFRSGPGLRCQKP